MKRKFHKPEQIVKKLREADAAISSGSTVDQVCRQLGSAMRPITTGASSTAR